METLSGTCVVEFATVTLSSSFHLNLYTLYSMYCLPLLNFRFQTLQDIGRFQMASHMLYSAHHDFFTTYMDDTKTIVVMDNTGKLTMTNDRDGKGSNKFPE